MRTGIRKWKLSFRPKYTEKIQLIPFPNLTINQTDMIIGGVNFRYIVFSLFTLTYLITCKRVYFHILFRLDHSMSINTIELMSR